MAVLINAQTGLAEDLAGDLADQAIAKQTHHIPLNDPEGNPVNVPHSDAQRLLSEGYKQPHPEQLQSLLDYSKYSGAGEELKAGFRGAASAATFGLSTEAEVLARQAMGEQKEDIQRDIGKSREMSPVAYGAGQAAGLVGSAFLAPELSAAKALGLAGETAAAKLGLAAAKDAPWLHKVGSEAAKGMVENALFQAGDEASKAFAGSPDASAENALLHVGISGALGGGIGAGIGAVSPLWRMAGESKLASVLSTLKNKAEGKEVADILPDAIEAGASSKAAQSSVDGVGPLSFGGLSNEQIAGTEAALRLKIPEEVKLGLSNDPMARGQYQVLLENNTTTAHKVQKSLNEFRRQTDDRLITSLGKTESDISALGDLNPYHRGQEVVKNITEGIEQKLGPTSAAYEEIGEKYASIPISNAKKAVVSNRINQIAQKEGYYLVPGSDEAKLMDSLINGLGKAENLEELKKVGEIIGGEAQRKQLYLFGRQIREAIDEASEDVLEKHLGDTASPLLEKYKAARAAYKNIRGEIEELNDALKVGSFRGPKGFLKNLSEMNPEDVLRRIDPKNKAALSAVLEGKFPAAAASVKSYLKDLTLKAAANKAKGDALINPKTLFDAMDKWSPQYRDFVLGGAQAEIGQIKQLMEALPPVMNPSGTAKTINAMMSGSAPTGLGAIIGALTHGGMGGAAGAILGTVGKHALNESKDAARLGVLKFLASDRPISSTAFKAMVDYADAMIKGQAVVNRASSAVFKASKEVLPQSLMPTPKSREKLDKQVKALQSNIDPLMKLGTEVGHYLPEHTTAMSSTVARTVSFLNSVRPSEEKMSPLDPELPPSQIAKDQYNRTLDIAQQPLITLQAVKDGTLTHEDVIAFSSMYPALYQDVSNKLMQQVIEASHKGETIPYASRLSLSLFVGQDLDTTMMPQSILAAQPKAVTQSSTIADSRARNSGSMKALGGLPERYMTPQQARQASKSSVT